ncbi:MAG TPA: DMT family transporter, partial [Cellvibrionaceae bacterium]
GLIAMIFSLSPFVTGLLSWWLLGDNPFNRYRLLALALAMVGLAVIFRQQLQVDASAGLGMLGILLSCFMFSLSSVWLKKLNVGSDAFNQTAGSLLFAMPGLLLVWWLFDGATLTAPDIRSASAIVYLAVFGSLLGFTLFFYVLSNMTPTAVSLITLITPVLALGVGALFAGELLTPQVIAGGSLVAAGLLLYLDVIPIKKIAKG